MNPEFLSSDMLTRFLWAALLTLSGLGLYRLGNRLLLQRANRNPHSLPGEGHGKPTLLYFTTPDCVPCKTRQRPAIERWLQISGEGVNLIEVNAVEEPHLARQWGVLSVPTTFIIDTSARARFVNHGVVSTEKLLQQFKAISGENPYAKHSHSDPLAHLHPNSK